MTPILPSTCVDLKRLSEFDLIRWKETEVALSSPSPSRLYSTCGEWQKRPNVAEKALASLVKYVPVRIGEPVSLACIRPYHPVKPMWKLVSPIYFQK
ncbi:hypothetical protein DAPPUDRAFT_238599 [Daphnia pulex]|uniref:Uncharacterized protein n=1 Tax=Daphnia pulex TaxID=6669 RepID=E9G6W1_DAPPU|nr:hypothetical protein DAPPUDRAFT_238599 [Daphnia pulex]|eukprot:EFX84747.1 hypothetical protein DAPPUDRAFT_238599 [Daphnia pulex]